jgi:hypothetical protein
MRTGIIYFYIFFSVLITAGTCRNDPAVLVSSGHSHNDYQQIRPLWEALEKKFISIEVDIHLSGRALLVGHDPEDLKAENTLQSMYLEPLHAYIAGHNGWVYPGHELILFIDIKTAADSTYIVLREVLNHYAGMLTVYSAEKVKKGAVAVVISGNRPRQLMSREKIRYATYDGRLTDLTENRLPNFMCLISDNWGNYFNWRGKKPISAEEHKKLAEIVSTAHAKDCMIRFWNLPVSDPSCRRRVWTELLSAGVDLISVDDLKAYKDFQMEKNYEPKK